MKKYNYSDRVTFQYNWKMNHWIIMKYFEQEEVEFRFFKKNITKNIGYYLISNRDFYNWWNDTILTIQENDVYWLHELN